MKQFNKSVIPKKFWAFLFLVSGICTASHSFAQDTDLNTFYPNQGQRLSDLMIQKALVPGLVDGYLPGIVLSRKNLVDKQTLKIRELKTQFAINSPTTPNYLAVLADDWVATGRQVLPSYDAQEMAAKPKIDPILDAGDSLFIPERRNSILYLGERKPCLVEHQPLVTIQAHLDSCFPKPNWYSFGQGFDKVWLVQPSGKIQVVKVGFWNASELVSPEPGAVIWAPQRNSSWTEELSSQLAQVLATQIGTFDFHAKAAADSETTKSLGSPDVTEESMASQILQRSEAPRDFGVRPTRSDWGNIGLMQTPNARMAEEGTVSVTASRVEPYSRYSFIYQPFEWMEAGFRYSIITNRSFGRADAGDRKYQDKSVDLKLRLLKESAYLPQIALGFRDIGGTGLFSSEYLVASKAAGEFDFSLGVGFGNMASGGGVSNPFSFINDDFRVRPAPDVGAGGQANSSAYFRGDASVFGGVEWQTPWRDWIVKLEYDGNDYSNEPLNNPQPHESHLNYGVVYRVNDIMDLQVGVERGNTFGVALSIQENIAKYSAPKLSDPPSIRVTSGKRPDTLDWQRTLKLIEQQTTWNVTDVEKRGAEVRLNVKNSDVTYAAKAANKASAVLHESLSEDVRWFSYKFDQRGLDVAEHIVDRDAYVTSETQLVPEQTTREPLVAIEPVSVPYSPVIQDKEPWYSGDLGLAYQQVFGGANGYLFEFSLVASGELQFNESTWLQGAVSHVLGGTFDNFSQTEESRLPQVRTNFRQYAVASDTKLSNLTINHVGELSQDHYYSLYAGYLERMFGGIGAEYLYRPFGSPVAFGIDINRVRQRAFEQDFNFQDYEVTTGHLTTYWDTGFEDILAEIKLGQYLAGDKGVTVDLSRIFNNGVQIGAFATKTNVSAEDFGEGSFDKGIYVKIPFDALFTSTVSGVADFTWNQVTRDGGARLGRPLRLYSQTQLRSPRVLGLEAYK